MSEFLNKLESVKNKAVEVTDKFIEFTDAFDDLYAYCKEAQEAREKRQSQRASSDENPLLSAYRNQI